MIVSKRGLREQVVAEMNNYKDLLMKEQHISQYIRQNRTRESEYETMVQVVLAPTGDYSKYRLFNQAVSSMSFIQLP